MAVTNFYEKYNIPQDGDLQYIQNWLKERIQNEERDSFSSGHKERLAEYKEAAKAFASEESRERYNESLNPPQEKSAAQDDERNAVYEKWLPTVYKFYNIGHYDIAKTAYENAVSGGSPDLENSEVFEFAARICEGTGEYDEALKYINKAVVGQSDDAKYLVSKSDILSTYETKAHRDKVDSLIEMEKRTLDLAVGIAEKNNDTNSLGNAYNNLAFVWYKRDGSDRDKAKEYAEKALTLSKMWIDAKKVLQDIYDKDSANFKLEIEKERLKFEALRNIDGQIAVLQEKINKKNTSSAILGIGIGAIVLGFFLLFAVWQLGIILLIIGGIMAISMGDNIKIYINPNEMYNLKNQRSHCYQDYERFRKNLQFWYKDFCAKFKDAAERFGIEYKNIDANYLNTASITTIKNIKKNRTFCITCGIPFLKNNAFCQNCGTSR